MRTSGGRGAEGWILAIPVVALIVVAALTEGGVDGMFVTLDRLIRTTIASVVDVSTDLF
jgi:hypothetical protein